MNFQEYQSAAARTKSDQFHPELVDPMQLASLCSHLILITRQLDAIKKALFYGKGEIPVNRRESSVPLLHNVNPDILHMVLGIVTEAGEILDEVYSSTAKGNLFNPVHLVDETGDSLWYLANLMTELDTELAACAELNIEKLRRRFPEKFTSSQAINRDIASEQEAFSSLY